MAKVFLTNTRPSSLFRFEQLEKIKKRKNNVQYLLLGVLLKTFFKDFFKDPHKEEVMDKGVGRWGTIKSHDQDIKASFFFHDQYEVVYCFVSRFVGGRCRQAYLS